MKDLYLEVTFRRGRLMAAYLYLPRQTGEKSSRTLTIEPGMVIDFGPSGNPIGIEITAPTMVTVAELNRVLSQLGLLPLQDDELASLSSCRPVPSGFMPKSDDLKWNWTG